jgi:hypothetical protein
MGGLRSALPLLVAASLVACGSDDDGGAEIDKSADARLAAAADRSARETTMRMRFDMKVESEKESFRFTGGGTSNDTGTSGRMDGRMVVDGEAFQMEGIIDGDSVYVRSPDFEEVMPAGKTWLRSTDSSQTLTMEQMLELIRATSNTEIVGAERLRGRPTTHYRSRVDFDEAVEKMKPDQADRMRKQIPGGGKDAALPIDVWVGDDDLVWRIKLKFDEGDLGAPDDMAADMGVDILEYGVKIDDKPPPASEVAEESELETG